MNDHPQVNQITYVSTGDEEKSVLIAPPHLYQKHQSFLEKKGKETTKTDSFDCE